MAQARALAEETLQEIVRRIVEVADPVKIVLFGSAARGDMGPHSDADFLVVVESPSARARGRHTHELLGDPTGDRCRGGHD